MAVFSDLPNELIVDIWGYVIEPEAVESFARVSKKIYSLSAPFVKKHASLKQQYSQIRFEYGSKPADLLEKMLLNPRIAFYISDLQIESWESCQNGWYTPQALSRETMAAFEHAIRACPLIAGWEVEDWVTDVMKGNEDPIIALIVMQLTKMESFLLDQSLSGADCYLLKTLERIIKSSESASQLGQSVVGTKVDDHDQDNSSAKSTFSTVRDMTMASDDIQLDVLCRMLRNMKELKSFTFSRSPDPSFETIRLCNELIECSQHSLRKLSIYHHGAEESPLRDFTRLRMLTELNIDFFLLLGSKGARASLAEVLPMSIERVTLFTGEIDVASEAAASKALEKVILEMIKSKMERLPFLEALTFNFERSLYPVAKDKIKLITDLNGVSEMVGVRLRAFAFYVRD